MQSSISSPAEPPEPTEGPPRRQSWWRGAEGGHPVPMIGNRRKENTVNDRFDELARALAPGPEGGGDRISRRGALRRTAGLFAGALLAALGLGRLAKAE